MEEQLSQMEEPAYACILTGVPKQIYRRKLERWLACRVPAELWRCERLIPLERAQLLHVVCRTESARNRLLQVEKYLPHHVAVHVTAHALPCDIAYPPLPVAELSDQPSLTQLNMDCWRHIIALGTLKDQLAWTKVCHLSLELVSDSWRRRFQTLHFDLQELECRHGLNAVELDDFCSLIGQDVTRLVYSSILYFPLIQRHLRDMPGNLMANAKRYVNLRLCRLLCHFPHLHTVEVEGKFVSDFAVREMARHCAQLRVLRLLDTGNRWLRGQHLHRFRNLEELCLKHCEILGRRHLRRACSANAHLQRLNVIECLDVYLNDYIQLQLCGHLQQLTQLHLSAFEYRPMVQAILDLPALQLVRFYWLSVPNFVIFEYMLFVLLQHHRRSGRQLYALEFHNERMYLENESQERLSANEYLEMREKVTIYGSRWRWEGEHFERMAQALTQLPGLEVLRWNYCRLLDETQLLQLPALCPRLRLVEYIGCRERSDDALQRAWRSTWCKCGASIESGGCRLRLVDGMPLEALDILRDQLGRRRHDDALVVRSIECRFK